MKTKVFINCEEAARRIVKAQYGEASFFETFTYKIHNLFCTLCRKYASKSKKLTQLLNSHSIKLLSPSQKTKMKEKLAEENLNY
jgi:hypothetical protein